MVQRVYDMIRSQIFSRALVAGSKVNLDQVARDLGVSTTPVREALNRLAAEGLAKYAAFTGYTLSPPFGAQELHKLHQIRELMESYGASEGAAIGNTEILAEMELRMREMEGQAEKMSFVSFKSFDRSDNDFHSLIIRSADNPYLVESYSGINARIRISRVYYAGGPTDMRAVLVEHQAIVEAYRRRDGAAAMKAVSSHLREASRRLSAMIEQFHEDAEGHSVSRTARPDRAP